MSGNTLGTLFTVTSFGESHGPAIGCIVDGCPPGLALCEADIQAELDRRKPGTSRHVTQRREPDTVEILSGVFEGVTTGTPISLLIRNQDQRSKDYGNIADTFRPGHADYAYLQKYGLRDHRGGGRSSARADRAGGWPPARSRSKWLKEAYGTVIRGCMSAARRDPDPVRRRWDEVARAIRSSRPTRRSCRELEAYMDALRKAGDSCGARIDVVAERRAGGLGEPLFDKLDADIAHAMMGINAVKGVEIGAGFASGRAEGQRARRRADARRASSATTPAACSAASPPASRHHSCHARDQADLEHPPAGAARSTCHRQAGRWSRRRAATIPASASAPRRSPRRCWRWC
jgi:chorismate synthase